MRWGLLGVMGVEVLRRRLGNELRRGLGKRRCLGKELRRGLGKRLEVGGGWLKRVVEVGGRRLRELLVLRVGEVGGGGVWEVSDWG